MGKGGTGCRFALSGKEPPLSLKGTLDPRERGHSEGKKTNPEKTTTFLKPCLTQKEDMLPQAAAKDRRAIFKDFYSIEDRSGERGTRENENGGK